VAEATDARVSGVAQTGGLALYYQATDGERDWRAIKNTHTSSSSDDQTPSLHGESSAERSSLSWSPSLCPIPGAGSLRLRRLRRMKAGGGGGGGWGAARGRVLGEKGHLRWALFCVLGRNRRFTKAGGRCWAASLPEEGPGRASRRCLSLSSSYRCEREREIKCMTHVTPGASCLASDEISSIHKKKSVV
jgi:hypothetical protein